MNRRPLIIANWKMHFDFVEAIHLVQQIGVLLRSKSHDNVDIVVAPPFVDIRSVASVIEADRLPLAVGAQHVNALESGAYTGEVSASMLRRLMVKFVLVGHSERRTLFSMTGDIVAETAAACLRHGITPVVCVGENSDEREGGTHREFVEQQLTETLRFLEGLAGSIVVAYEPLWAIGTGKVASTGEVDEMSKLIRATLAQHQRGESHILYGGSVKTDNAAELITIVDIDGFLIGGASLKAESFVEIVSQSSDCYGKKR